MTGRWFCAAAGVVAFSWLTLGSLPGVASAQGAADDGWTLPRTPAGQPDLQGKWTMATFTPLERPERFGNQAFLSEEEAAALQKQLTAEGVDPLRRDAFGIADPEDREESLQQVNRDQSYVHYDNAVWLRTEQPKGLTSRQTSLIVDPPNGRIPPLTTEAQVREERRLISREHLRRSRPNPVFDSYETRSLAERCIAWRHEGAPMTPPSYNDILQIFQTPDYVVIFPELSTNLPRIIPVIARPHINEKIRQWSGHSSGHWEGDTFVVETTNFTHKTHFNGASEALRVVERFTRVGEERIVYEWTVDDPKAFTQPWSAEVPMIKTDEMIFEYACHEGNHDIVNILTMSRNLERQEAERKAKATSK